MISTQLQKKRRLIDGKIIVGIDPAKAKHQAAVIDPAGDQVGKSFSFDVTSQGYTTVLWQKLLQIVPNCNPDTTDFAKKLSRLPPTNVRSSTACGNRDEATTIYGALRHGAYHIHRIIERHTNVKRLFAA